MKRQTLGARLAQKRREKAAREHRDIQQIDVAHAVGVSKASVSRYENDVDTPRDAVLDRLAAFLDTTPAFLRYGVGESVSADVELINPALDRRLTAEEIARARAQVAAARASKTSAKPPVRKRGNGKG